MEKLCLLCFLLILITSSGLAVAQDHPPAFQLTYQIGRGHIQSIEWNSTDDVILVSTIRGAWFYDSLLHDLGYIEAARLAAFSPDGELVAGVDAENRITLWNGHTYTPVGTLPGHGSFVTAVAWSPGGEYLASADDGGSLFVWDIQGQQAVSTWLVAGTVATMRWSPDGTMLAMVMQDTALYVYDVGQKRQVVYAVPTRCCRSGESSPDVVWTDNQSLIRGVLDIIQGEQYEQWNIKTGDLISERWPQINMNLTPAKAYSPDGSMRAQSSTEYIGVDLNISVAIVDNHTNLYVCTF